MSKWTNRFVILCACLLASVSVVYAHHSLAGVYAMGKEAKVTGAFKAFRLVNPHTSLRIDVKGEDGQTVEWAIVGGSVQQIARLGLSRTNEGPNALHPGDQITVTIVPALDGKSPVGLLRAITYPDGHTVRFRSPDE
jgi:Family of unknown function (DUF6152)